MYLVSQTINESAYGTSALSKKVITKVITGDSVKKDANGNVTGFQKVNGKYITKQFRKQQYIICMESRHMTVIRSFVVLPMRIIWDGQV